VRKYLPMMLALACSAVLMLAADAQPPGGDKEKDYSNSSIVKGMLAFDREKTGKLTKEMVTDPRLHRLFDRADTNKDGVVTREELISLAAKIDAEFPPGKFGKGKDGFGKDKKKKKKDFGDKE
jgi:Ca2+-binding EF-hand superfamily protein